MKHIITFLLVLIVPIVSKAQRNKIEKEYLMKLGESFFDSAVIVKPAALFWSRCLGERLELSSKDLHIRVNNLIENEAERNAFYRRLNYYLSSTLEYYKDLLKMRKVAYITRDIEREMVQGKGDYLVVDTNKVAIPIFTIEELREYMAYIHGMGEDPMLAKYAIPIVSDKEIDTSTYSIAISVTHTYQKVWDSVEMMPMYIGGEVELSKFIKHNIVYPEWEKQRKTKGEVIVRFVVNLDGIVTGVAIAKETSLNMDAEAKRLIKMLPQFIPGMQNGTPVNVFYFLPIVFGLE